MWFFRKYIAGTLSLTAELHTAMQPIDDAIPMGRLCIVNFLSYYEFQEFFMSIPTFGVGTFRLQGQAVIDSVRNALELGYRAIDTAQIYGNEAEIGQAIVDSGVKRDDVFLTTKIWVDNYAKDKLIPSLKESLVKLRTDDVDLTLIHWPAPDNGVSLEEFMMALAEAKAQGLTRQIGISNFNINLTRQAIAVVGKEAIATN